MYEEVVQKLQKRYDHIHPLIFHRTVERAKTQVELFDLLEGFVNQYPLLWNNELHNWVITDDPMQRSRL